MLGTCLAFLYDVDVPPELHSTGRQGFEELLA